jgi:hypothetical protein
MKQGINSMSSVVDFLEKMGSEAHWRDALQDEVKLALADAGIEAPMCAAILTKNAALVQALLGQGKLISEQIPSPEEVPQPEPEEEEDEEQDDETHDGSKASNSAYDSSSPSSSSSL